MAAFILYEWKKTMLLVWLSICVGLEKHPVQMIDLCFILKITS